MHAYAWLRKYGAELFDAAVDELIAHGERITRAAIEKIPDGVYEAQGYHDADGSTDDPIHIQVKVTVKGGDIYVDFTGSDAQRDGAAGNCHWVNTVSMTREFMMLLSDVGLGGNEGSYAPIHIIAPEGSVFKPSYPAPVTTGMDDMGTQLSAPAGG